MYTYDQLIFPSNTQQKTRIFAIAGFSLNGPVDSPFILQPGVDPVDVLGECRMAEDARAAIQRGITPLIVRLNGSHGECVLKHDTLGVDVLRFKTIEAADEANNIEIHLFPTHMLIKGLRTTHSYLFADYSNMGELVTAIKLNLYFAKAEVDVEVIKITTLEGLCIGEKHLLMSGADDGFNFVSNHDESDGADKAIAQIELLKEKMLDEEEAQLQFAGELSGFEVDTLLFTDIAYEKAPEELANIFGKYAQTKTAEQSVFCSVVLCSNHFAGNRFGEEGEDSYAEPLAELISYPNLIGAGEHLQHIEVVIGTSRSDNPGYSAMPCAAIYACTRYKLPELHHSATNKALIGLNALQSKELSQDEVANLSRSGYICIVPSIKKGFVPFSSKNLYPSNTLRSKPHYLRSIHSDVNRIASYFNRHIGSHTTSATIQSIISQVTSFINTVKAGHPIYQDLSVEVIDYDRTNLTLSVLFSLYGEVERVRTSFEYVPASEVNITWS